MPGQPWAPSVLAALLTVNRVEKQQVNSDKVESGDVAES